MKDCENNHSESHLNSADTRLFICPQVLGTPTREQIREMNPNYTEFKFPQIKAHPWTKVRTTAEDKPAGESLSIHRASYVRHVE